MEKYILVENISTLINSVVDETFKSAQRIKLKSFDVSKFYIIFGASSGGTYIFKRSPCEFLKLIPSKEGSASIIRISSNEKNLAVATSAGVLLILEDFLLDVNSRPQVYKDHEGSVITEIKWHGNDLYCGDNTGKISIYTLSTLLTKTIFQVPSAVLMQLDSCIIQIDCYLHYLLISTKTRTYLCDTQKEQYKQIGKKLRDGNFGACFFSVSCNDAVNTHQISGDVFKTIKEGEEFSSSLKSNDTKIYCARPGVRLWEANFDASVLATHPFRNSLCQSPSPALLVEEKVDAKFKISTLNNVEVPKSFNFGKIYPVHNKFIFTHDSERLYFFDPAVCSLVFWNHTFERIREIRILNSHVFIWMEGLKFKIISLELLENLLISTLYNKQYYLCAEICINYIEDVQTLVETSKKIHLISILKTKLVEIEANELLSQLKDIFDLLDEYYNDQKLGVTENGIVTIENIYRQKQVGCDGYLTENIQDFDENAGLSHRKDENLKLLCLYKQYILNKSHVHAELTDANNLLKSLNLDDILLLLEDFIEYVKDKDGDDASVWCQQQILKEASRNAFDITEINQKTLQFISDAFLNLNNSAEFSCKCKFPLPKAHKMKLKEYYLGRKLFDQLETKQEYLSQVPYLYKHYLEKLDNLHDIMLNLALITQFNDEDVFKEFIAKFMYDTWDETTKLFIKLKEGFCLNCGEIIDIDDIWSWSKFGLLMVESIGPKNASKLLKRHSQYIPCGELGTRFYQSCIFAATFDEPKLAVDFMENMVNESNSQKFTEQMERFLHKKFLAKHSQVMVLDVMVDPSKCTLCKLPLSSLILVNIKKCECGHNFHTLCYNFNNDICNICSAIS